VIVATGVTPRDPEINGQDLPHVVSYIDLLSGKIEAGDTVVVIGAGGIGFDVSEFLVDQGHSATVDLETWKREWGVGDPSDTRGGLAPDGAQPNAAQRSVTVLQRKPEKPGKRLGKTTGWIHRAALRQKGVKMIAGVAYDEITADGILVTRDGEQTLLPADTIVLCAGQVSERSLADTLAEKGQSVHVIGGADVAAELDAKRAIDQGTRLAATL